MAGAMKPKNPYKTAMDPIEGVAPPYIFYQPIITMTIAQPVS